MFIKNKISVANVKIVRDDTRFRGRFFGWKVI